MQGIKVDHFSFIDVINRICRNGKATNIPRRNKAAKIMRLYFAHVIKELLSGHIWNLPRNFGTLKGIKHTTTPSHNIPQSTIASFENGKRTKAINLRKLGYHYTIELKSDILENAGIKFKAAECVTKEFSRLLRETDLDYSF